MGLTEWRAALGRTIQSYAELNGLDVKPLAEELIDD